MSWDTLLVLLDWLGPIHVMALVRADPSLRDFIQQRLGKSVYQVCMEKIHYYAVQCSSTAVLSPEQWAHLMAPRNVNDFFMGGGEYLCRALTFDFTHPPMRAEFTGRVSWSDFNLNARAYSIDIPLQLHLNMHKNRIVHDEKYTYRSLDSHRMSDKPSLLSSTQIFQIHRNYLSPSELFIAHPASMLHNTSVIDANHHNFLEYYSRINAYAKDHPDHRIFIDSAMSHYDGEAWANVVRRLRELQHPNVVFT
jgi:hypothetical protein